MSKFTSTLLLCWGIFCLACGKTTPDTPAPTPKETPDYVIRGLWLPNVDTQALNSREGLKQVVNDCVTYGFNRIYVCVWNQGYTHYPSQLMKDTFGVAINPKYEGRDPLKELIEEAHAKKIKVIAWYEYGFASDYSGSTTHILDKKPTWAGRSQDGKVLTKSGFRWLNAFDPAVQKFMIDLILEAVKNYDIDGIQGDDRLPALPVEGGYDDMTKALFKKETGQDAPSNTLDSQWLNWRTGKLNGFMEQLYTQVKAAKKSCIVSMAPSIFPWGRDNYLQDWPTWVKNGWVEEIIPQVYRYDIASYQNELNKIVNTQVPKERLSILSPGVLLKAGSYVATPEFLKQMTDANRKAGLPGEVFFHYEGLKTRKDFFGGLYQ